MEHKGGNHCLDGITVKNLTREMENMCSKLKSLCQTNTVYELTSTHLANKPNTLPENSVDISYTEVLSYYYSIVLLP